MTDQVIERLQGVRRNGSGWLARCPAHDDHKPSLSVSVGRDGRALIKCHAGCTVEDIVRTLGLQMTDLFSDDGGTTIPAPAELVREHPPIEESLVKQMHDDLSDTHRNYLRESRCLTDDIIDQNLLGFTRKWNDDRVAIPIITESGICVNIRCWLPEVHRNGKASKMLQWARGYGTPPKLFPVGQLVNDELVLTSGELDALALISNGIPAITVTCGESTWPDELSRHFEGKTVTIPPDNDEAGYKCAQRRAESLHRVGVKVRIARWPI